MCMCVVDVRKKRQLGVLELGPREREAATSNGTVPHSLARPRPQHGLLTGGVGGVGAINPNQT